MTIMVSAFLLHFITLVPETSMNHITAVFCKQLVSRYFGRLADLVIYEMFMNLTGALLDDQHLKKWPCVIQTENSTPRYNLLDWRQGISV